MKQKVVVARRIFPELIEELRARYDLVDNQYDAPLSAEQFGERLLDADGVLTTPGETIDETLLLRCPRLKVASNIAVGFNNIDVAACTAAGVAVTNTPDVLNEAAADHAWALLLAAARRIGEAERTVREGRWKRWAFEMLIGAEVHGTVLGIIGMGRIGRAVARRAHGFDMRVVYHNRARLPPSQEDGAEWMDLESVLRMADHLIVAVPYSRSSHHLINAERLAMVKPTAVLVNVARGGVVHDAALADALRNRRLAAAGLDVFENEPCLDRSFLELDNVVLTPHIGSSTREARTAMASLAIANLDSVLAGRRPTALVNSEVWESSVRRIGTA